MLNIREICKDIIYVGVDDRTTTKFEALWALPEGVSYNSYIVKDKKTALIDSVELGQTGHLLANLREVVGEESIDYLIVNHMEPDHSGGIPVVLNAYPKCKLVGNRQTLQMVKGFYQIDDPERLVEVADGDTLSLGEKTLTFHLTPMVHWPETMMTYCAERKVLFAGDAFGTFGALNGAVTDDEGNQEVSLREMYRYYACIVAKYGKFVQRALQKVGSLPMDFVCSTHGPVWHSMIGEVTAIYDRLSRGESEPGVTIIYGSMYGNTQAIAERIAAKLADCGIKEIHMHNASHADMSVMISDAYRYKGLIVGAPTYSMTLFPPVDTFMKAMVTREVKDKVFASFGSFTWAPASKRIIDAYAETLGWPITAGMTMKMAPNEASLQEADELAMAVAEALKC
ncbi:MAG: FprA family A-type flavoprotein [Clostridium sp.]|nr:FprA family A-type flavoprotein [Prevotella sp.]MCM1429236.1 FprA family A-type flavoprotein [Clostridium sp.]MCM1475731.1 FprA family A-type flavoprotein [Muribaculaceae bacterium]